MNFDNDNTFKYKRKHSQSRDIFEIISEIIDDKKKYKLKPTEKNGKSSFALALSNAKIILSADFPELKFRSRSESFSGGSSFSLTAVEFKEKINPKPEISELFLDKILNRMKEIEHLFRYGSFDGSTDSYDHIENALQKQFQSLYGSVAYSNISLERSFYNLYEEKNKLEYKERQQKYNNSSTNTNKMKP